jgi:hypothetical protein
VRLSGVGADIVDRIHILREPEDDGLVDCLTGEASPAAAREHRNLLARTVGDHARDVLGQGREDHTEGDHLAGTGVGRVHLPGVGVEADFTADAFRERVD